MINVLSSLLLCFLLPVHSLTLTDLYSDHLIFQQPIAPQTTFKTVYIHSLELTPVWEYFQIDDNYEIILTDTLYISSGAGLPIPIQGEDHFSKDGEQFHIFDMNRRLTSIDLRINRQYENIFFFGQTTRLNLSELLGNTVVRLQTTTLPLGLLLYRDLYEMSSSR